MRRDALRWLVLGLALAILPSTVRAEIVFDNTTQAVDGAAQLSVNGASSWNYGAQQFNTGANTAVSSVSLLLNRSGTGGTFSVELWSNAIVSGTAVPGTLIGTLGSGATDGLVAFVPTLTTFSNTVAGLTENTDYWVVFNATSVGPGQTYWSYTSGGGTGVTGTGFMKTDDGAGFLESYGTYRGIMSVQAVPEPSTYALAAIGFGIAGCVRARRRKASV